LLANPDIQVTPDDIMAAHMHFREALQIRQSSPLFHLQTAEDVQARLSFPNSGEDQTAGVIMIKLSDDIEGLPQLDPNYATIIVIINADDQPFTYVDETIAGAGFVLHPVQQASFDSIVQTASYDSAISAFTVPARTTAVFVLPR
ncbi:MAG: alpha-1,6-glucosidase domain-containing protein, partial [bacterium]|nr:alpha-1,6-glucosidase domain-containing protein [bacterium]